VKEQKRGKSAKRSKNETPQWLRMLTPAFYVTLMITSVLSANSGLIKQQEFSYPSEMTTILNNKAAQAELSNYNYLTTYRALSNTLGFVGDTHWVGKAPNDILLGTRMNNEMRIICFVNDVACAPKTLEITGNILNTYGFRIYQSPITTAQYAALKPLDRFYADMDAVGQARFEVPDRFVGGNPLLKPNK